MIAWIFFKKYIFRNPIDLPNFFVRSTLFLHGASFISAKPRFKSPNIINITVLNVDIYIKNVLQFREKN
jgi:hypothetical protein